MFHWCHVVEYDFLFACDAVFSRISNHLGLINQMLLHHTWSRSTVFFQTSFRLSWIWINVGLNVVGIISLWFCHPDMMSPSDYRESRVWESCRVRPIMDQLSSSMCSLGYNTSVSPCSSDDQSIRSSISCHDMYPAPRGLHYADRRGWTGSLLRGLNSEHQYNQWGEGSGVLRSCGGGVSVRNPHCRYTNGSR